jgi:ABC-type multidrug transport system ATPase subunit
MRIKYVEIGGYRRLENCLVRFESTTSNSLIKDLYGKLGLTLIAGPNGSGKTSLLSFVAQIFHNLQRFPERVKTNFCVGYIDNHGRQCKIYRNGKRGAFWLNVENKFDLPVVNVKSGSFSGEDQEFVCYEKIKEYLPPVVIISIFSLHGEYPSSRPSNFIGDRRVAVYDVSHLYGYNHFRLPSFSRAISVLMSAVRKRSAGVKAIEKLIGAKFTGDVRIHHRGFNGEIIDDEWVPFSQKIKNLEKSQSIYINDMSLMTFAGSELRLSNMSSGQKMLFIRLLSILDKIEDGALVLIEEPEMHLDPVWSRQIISLLLLFFREYNAHVLIATHSFSLLNAVPNECVLLAKSGEFSLPSSPTLLGNESALSFALYGPNLHEVEKEVVKFYEHATLGQLEKLLPQLAESSVRYDVFARIIQLSERKNAKSK